MATDWATAASGSLTKLSVGCAALSGWRAIALALALGVAAALALPPVYLLVMLIPAFTGFTWLLGGGRSWGASLVLGWGFGFGFFATGLYWIGNSVLVDAERFGWLWPFAVTGLPAGLALFIALAAALVRALVPAPDQHLARAFALTAAWGVAEWLRGHVLTGFPWNQIGYVWSVSDATIQIYSLAGIGFIGILTVLSAALPAALVPAAGRTATGMPAACALICATFAVPLLIWTYGAWRLAVAEETQFHPKIRLRIVQPNIPQHLKWLPARRDENFKILLEQSMAPAALPFSHVIWPESAPPFFLERERTARKLIADMLQPDRSLLTGAVRFAASGGELTKLWNSVLIVGADGQIQDRYDKFHLVPFGEYLPWRNFLAKFNIDKLAAGAVDYHPGPPPGLLRTPSLPSFRALICYEVIFPGEVRRAGRPEWLLNVTNDAWFGDSSGPRQHFAAARARAVELGVPLVRSANTGISGVIDGHGRVLAKLAMQRRGHIDSRLPKSLKIPPPYLTVGEIPFSVLLIVLAGGALWFRAGCLPALKQR